MLCKERSSFVVSLTKAHCSYLVGFRVQSSLGSEFYYITVTCILLLWYGSDPILCEALSMSVTLLVALMYRME
jgi:hypothetical protein